MNLLNNREYYQARVEASRDLAARAASPQIAAIHSAFATSYERTLAEISVSDSISASASSGEGLVADQVA